jgi:PAS domain-containing protein
MRNWSPTSPQRGRRNGAFDEQRTRLIVDSLKDCAIYALDRRAHRKLEPGAALLTGYSEAEALGAIFAALSVRARRSRAAARRRRA